MNLPKTYADADEVKRKNEENNAHTSNKKKQPGKNTEKNICRHHGTHPWTECSLNPQSKSYHMNPRSPFYRGGRGTGRGDGGRAGRFSGTGQVKIHRARRYASPTAYVPRQWPRCELL